MGLSQTLAFPRGMKRDLMEILCCPVCKGDLELRVDVEKDERQPEHGRDEVHESRLSYRMALITAAIAAENDVNLYYGTHPSWTFVHRWVLMAAGVGSGIGWAELMMSTGNSIRRMSSGFK